MFGVGVGGSHSIGDLSEEPLRVALPPSRASEPPPRADQLLLQPLRPAGEPALRSPDLIR